MRVMSVRELMESVGIEGRRRMIDQGQAVRRLSTGKGNPPGLVWDAWARARNSYSDLMLILSMSSSVNGGWPVRDKVTSRVYYTKWDQD